MRAQFFASFAASPLRVKKIRQTLALSRREKQGAELESWSARGDSRRVAIHWMALPRVVVRIASERER